MNPRAPLLTARAATHRAAWRAALALVALCGCVPAFAQQLEPRAYSPSPSGTSFLVADYRNTSGDVVFDSTSTLPDAHASVDIATVAYGHVFALAGHQASLAGALPFVHGEGSGDVGAQTRSIERNGLGDPQLRFSVLLAGGEALDRAAFARRTPGPVLGASLAIVVPLGQYDPSRYVNIGMNRYAAHPELGVAYPLGRWEFDLAAGIWLYSANTDYLNGHRRTQDPVTSYQSHVSYTFRPGLWLALDATYYTGGAVSVDGVRNNGLQNNWRAGSTLSVPIAPRQTLKFAFSDGVITRAGGQYRTFAISWQHLWFD